jgi:hypothetical protein
MICIRQMALYVFLSICSATASFQLIVTPRTLIVSTRSTSDITGGGIGVAPLQRGERDEDNLDRLRSIQSEVVFLGPILNVIEFSYTRLAIGSRNDEIGVVSVFVHLVTRGDEMQIGSCDDICSRHM